MATVPTDFDAPLSVPREVHTQGRAAFEAVDKALLATREALLQIETELQRKARELSRKGVAREEWSEIVGLVREKQADLARVLGKLRVAASDFRSCDGDLTPIRRPSEAALAAFRTSSQFPGVK